MSSFFSNKIAKHRTGKSPISKQKTLWLLFVIWLHITLLDLFYVTHRGPVFLWEENSRLSTLITHLGIALLSLGMYLLFSQLRRDYTEGKYVIGEKIWFACSIALVLSIGFLIL